MASHQKSKKERLFSMKKQKIKPALLEKMSLNETKSVPEGSFYHCVIFNYYEAEHYEIFIKNTDFYIDDIKAISAIKADFAFNDNSEEFHILQNAIEKYSYIQRNT